MAFEVRISQQTAGDRSGDVHEVISDDGAVRAEIWPQWGFNCLRWQVRQADGRWGDVLCTAGDWDTNPVPTRSGHPILFPFPGRMRDARFTFEGKTYQLPATDSSKQNAIHGFTPRNPWKVIDSNGDDDFGFVTGRFNLKKDFPAALAYWPADFNLNVTYRLHRDRLRVQASLENLGPGPLPWGLGYHPYFRLPGVNDEDISRYVLQARASEVWETENSLPTGWRKAVPGDIDFRHPMPIGSTQLDNVLTDLQGKPPAAGELGELLELASLSHPEANHRLTVLADKTFRELVLFTPPHRHAIAIEPYTCSADAANLAARGIDSGWKVLGVGEEIEAVVEYRLTPTDL
jgi:aldose 1-epimerase